MCQVAVSLPLLGIDFDNDSAFMNELVVSRCRSQGLEVTPSRAYRKNDQAWVEQKNGAIVRRLVGYGRFVGAEVTAALVRLYDAVRLHVNLFQPAEPGTHPWGLTDGSCWDGVIITSLLAKGYRVTAAQIPLTTLADDVASPKMCCGGRRSPSCSSATVGAAPSSQKPA